MLTETQRKAREGKLTASRVACLMTADNEAIMQLWKEMIGETQEEDLSHVWPVQLGNATEKLNLDWYEARNSHRVIRRGDVIVHPKYPDFACTLDGWIDELNCPIDAKHVGGREPIEVVVQRYAPQMQWQMEVTGTPTAALSIIHGAQPPVIEWLKRNAEYAAELIRRGLEFMKSVHDRTPPVIWLPIEAPVEAKREVDMSHSPLWRRHAARWIQAEGAARTAEEASRILKAMVPRDAWKATGYGIRITRDRADRLSLRRDE